MSGDINDAAKIGLCLLILVAIVAIVMHLLNVSNEQANTGSQKLAKSMAKIEKSEFNKYDQKTVTGVDVATAAKVFEGRPIAIVHITLSKIKGGDSTGYNYNCLLTNAVNYNTVGTRGRNLWQVDTEDTSNGGLHFVEEENCYHSRLEVDHDTGEYEYNNDISPINKVSTDSYITSTGAFKSNLIKDENNNIIGIVFKQIE